MTTCNWKKLIFLIILYSFLSVQSQAQQILIPEHYPTIQQGIIASEDGDTILINDGTYYENLVIRGKEITIASRYIIDGSTEHIAKTVIDGSKPIISTEGSVLMFYPGDRPYLQPQVIGLTITNGKGKRIEEAVETPEGTIMLTKYVGAGIYIERMNPVFTKNRIISNKINGDIDYWKTKLNKGEDIGGGSYTFMGKPNFGGQIDGTDMINPGGNIFLDNYAPIGKTFYAKLKDSDDVIHFENCYFDVFSSQDTAVSTYWVTTNGLTKFDKSAGRESALTVDVYVSPDGNNKNTGMSADKPFRNIWYALSKVYGDSIQPVTIHLAPGIYAPSTNEERYPLQMVNWVSIIGAGKNVTILDAEANENKPKRLLVFENVDHVTIDSLTLTGGYNDVWNGGGCGGAVLFFNSSPTLSNLIITGNSAGAGGGAMYCFHQSNPLIKQTQIVNNTADNTGGAVFCFNSSPHFEDVTISNNQSYFENGGGIYCAYSDPVFDNVSITNNIADFCGGGIALHNSNPEIRNSSIDDNSAAYGGGMYCSESNPRLYRSTIRENFASGNGGGIVSFHKSKPHFENTEIVNNKATGEGGGIYAFVSTPVFDRVTLCGNESGKNGGGMYAIYTYFIMVNSVVWQNNPQQLYSYPYRTQRNFSDSMMIAYSNIQGGKEEIVCMDPENIKWLEGNMDKDPLFVNPADNDFSIQQNSPMIDAGTAFFKIYGKTLISLSRYEYKGLAPDIGAKESDISTQNNQYTINEDNDIIAYPNPFSSALSVHIKTRTNDEKKIRIYDIFGREVKSWTKKPNTEQRITLTWFGENHNAESVPEGMYFLNVQDETNQNRVIKIILQR